MADWPDPWLSTGVFGVVDNCADGQIRIFKSLVILVLLYSCETWIMNTDLKRRIDAFHTRCLRMIMGYCWNDFVSNQRLFSETDLRPITSIIPAKDCYYAGDIEIRWIFHSTLECMTIHSLCLFNIAAGPLGGRF